VSRPGPTLVLASASPRRAELLRTAGIPFTVAVANVDERERPGEAPHAYVERLAHEKAIRVEADHPRAFVLGADTTVVVDGAVLGKPSDKADAAHMLGRLAGRRHQVLTGLCLRGPDGFHRSDVITTVVEFAPLSCAEIAAYVATGEPMDKAGAYAVQGLASRFITRIEGSYPNVVGLPVEVVYAWCGDAGIQVS
jgi:septum formation protein